MLTKKMLFAKLTAGLAALLVTVCAFGCAAATDEHPEAKLPRTPLTFATWGDEEAYVRQVVDVYNKINGSEAVHLVVIPNPDWPDYLAGYREGDGIDILALKGNTELVMMHEKGILVDLSPWMNSSGIDVAAYGTMFNDLRYEGGYYAMPTRSTCWALYYDRAAFDGAGIPYPEGITWDEYIELSGSLAAEGRTGEERRWGGYFPHWILNIPAVQKSYYLVDDDLFPTGEAMGIMKRIYTAPGHMSYSDVAAWENEYMNLFAQGGAAMMVNGEWLTNMLLELGDEVRADWDVAPLPVPEGVEPGTTVGMYQFAAITKDCKDPQAAFDFLAFLCGEEGAGIYADNAIIPAYTNDMVRERYMDAAGVEHSEVFFGAKRIPEQPLWRKYDVLNDSYKKTAEKYILDEISFDEAVKEFEEFRDALYEDG